MWHVVLIDSTQGFEQCLELVSYEFERVFYTNNFASAITIFSIYMTYGGTNWGNLGHPGVYCID